MESVMKTHVTELPRIGKHERAFSLVQNEMIMFSRLKVGRFNMRLSGHAEMNAERIVAGKFEEHLLSAPRRSQQFSADETSSKQVSIRAAEDVFTGVEHKIDNLLTVAGVPLLAIPFDFGQFGHRAGYA